MKHLKMAFSYKFSVKGASFENWLIDSPSKWSLDGPAMSGYRLYSLANPANANSYYNYLVLQLIGIVNGAI